MGWNGAFPGGSSGGGSINIFLYNQNITEIPTANINVEGGDSAISYYYYNRYNYTGSKGGLGSWEIGTINNDSYTKISP